MALSLMTISIDSQLNSTQHHDAWPSDNQLQIIKLNDIQHSDTLPNGTQFNDSQTNDAKINNNKH